MSDIKLCKDCKHSRRNLLLGWSYAKCYAEPAVKRDPVTGKLETKEYCEISRKFRLDDCCGPEALWFERTRKPVWLKFLAA